ncbi:hypothetical protein BDZ45DRAFT_687222 [Acephala macrosclerotiorum]|nr:hypothetical protein BDZ45DRAFT_687222 [Acephala macrosclerotiorum]
MPARFDDLPTEIQLNIFELAAFAHFRPRVVEIYYKNGQIYSKTAPPPLLQVCHLSRHVTLKIYKPWLPQFKGTRRHQRYKKLVSRKDLDRLQNVCISLDYDLLVFKGLPDFGHIPRLYLRHLANDLHGWVNFRNRATALAKFRSLRRLIFFDEDDKHGSLRFKASRIESTMARISKKGRKNDPEYVSPKVCYDRLHESAEFAEHVNQWRHVNRSNWWFKYKYSRTFEAHGILDAPQGRPRARIATCNGYTLKKSSQDSRKRTRDEFEGDEARSVPRRAAKRSSPIEKAKTGPKRGRGRPRKVAATSFENFVDLSRPDGPSILTETPKSPLIQFKNPLDGWDDDMPWTAEEVMAESGSISPQIEAGALTSCSRMSKRSMSQDSKLLKAITTDEKALDFRSVDARDQSFQALYSFIEADESPPDDLILPGDDAQFDSPHAGYTLFDSMQLDDTTPDEQLQAELVASLHQERDMENGFVPERIMAERDGEGPEYLVKWENYPDEKDWTWEPEENMLQDVPDLVNSWRRSKSNSSADIRVPVATLEDVPEKIHEKKKINGIPRYLVQWIGYPSEGDWTWERCERFRVDAPVLVEAFEAQNIQKRGRGRPRAQREA